MRLPLDTHVLLQALSASTRANSRSLSVTIVWSSTIKPTGNQALGLW